MIYLIILISYRGGIMKIMIIGSEGMLGHDLVDVLSAEHEITTTTIDTLDITDINKTERKLIIITKI